MHFTKSFQLTAHLCCEISLKCILQGIFFQLSLTHKTLFCNSKRKDLEYFQTLFLCYWKYDDRLKIKQEWLSTQWISKTLFVIIKTPHTSCVPILSQVQELSLVPTALLLTKYTFLLSLDRIGLKTAYQSGQTD